MSLNPQPLEQKFRNNREAPKTTPVDIAQQITDWYDNQVFSNNTELAYKNPPLTVNKSAFYSALAPAYVDVETSQKSPNPSQLSIIESAHESAALAYWTGGQMAKTNPPPSAVSINNHPITNPGSFSVSLSERASISEYVGTLASAHEDHLLTVQGNAISQMPDGSVQNFPWTGIG